MIGGDRVRDILQEHGFTGPRRRHNESALTLAERRDDIDDARRKILSRRIFDFHVQPLSRVKRRQIVEVDLVLDVLRLFEIDFVDLEESEVALALFRTTDMTLDGIAGTQSKPTDLGGRYIDVVRSGQVIRIGRTKKAKAVQKNFNDACADNLDILGRQLFQSRKHQLLLAQSTGIFNADFFGEAQHFGRRLLLQVFQLDFTHRRAPEGLWRK